MTTINDVQQIAREVDKIVKSLTQAEKSTAKAVDNAKTLKGGTGGGGGGNPQASFGGLSGETQDVLNRYSAMGSGGKGGLMATSLGVITAGIGSVWNSVPGVDDAYAYKQSIFNTAFAAPGKFNSPSVFGRIQAGFGAGMDATSLNATNSMTNAGIGPASSRFNQTMNQAGMLSSFSGRSNEATTSGMISLQQGSQGVVGNLASYGIFVTDPRSGKSGGIQSIVDQLWRRWYGSSTAKVNPIQFEADLMGGAVGSDLAFFFGGTPELKQNVIDALRMKMKAGGASLSMGIGNTGKNSANKTITGAGVTTEDQPWLTKMGIEQGRMDNIADSSTALIKGFQDAAVVINKFNDAVNAFINSEAGQLAFRGKGALDTLTGSQELGGLGGFLGGLGMLGLGRMVSGGFGALRGMRGGPKVTPLGGGPGAATRAGGSLLGRMAGPAAIATAAATVGYRGVDSYLNNGWEGVGNYARGVMTNLSPQGMLAGTGRGLGAAWGALSNGGSLWDALGAGFDAGDPLNASFYDSPGFWGSSASNSQVSVYGGGANESGASTSSATTSGASGATIASLATGYIGSPYVAGGRSEEGWDCAGFTYALYKKLGVNIPQVSWEQIKHGTPVASINDAVAGDLLFFHVTGGHSRDPGPLKVNHVGVFIDKKTMVHAANSRSGTVKTSLPYSGGKLVGIRRYLDASNLTKAQQGVLKDTLNINGESGDKVGASGALGTANTMSAGVNLGGIWGSGGSVSKVLADSGDTSTATTGTTADAAAGSATVASLGTSPSGLDSITPGTNPKGAWKQAPLGDANLISVLKSAGFVGEDLREAYAISMRESSGDPSAFNGNLSTGDYSYGLFQINMLNGLGPERDKKFSKYVSGYNGPDSLFDANVNARAAAYMSQKGNNWSSWRGVSGNAVGYYNSYPGASAGMYVSKDQLVNVHAGEVIVPATQTNELRELLQSGFDSWKKSNNITINVHVKNASREEATKFAKWIKQDLQKESVVDRMRSK